MSGGIIKNNTSATGTGGLYIEIQQKHTIGGNIPSDIGGIATK